MKSVLFSAKAANQINEKVQKKVAAHLFIFCNYEPTTLQVHNEDAKFTMAVLNCYKLLIDSSIINRIIARNGLANQNNIIINWKTIQRTSKEINAIRTMLGHNQSEKNGTDENKYVFSRWVKRYVGKDYPETMDDFKLLLSKLEAESYTCIQILDDFINKASELSPVQKEHLIYQWEQEIIKYYCRGRTNLYIFLGQLKGIYYAKYPKEKEDALLGVTTQIDYKFAYWIQRNMMNPMEAENDKLQSILDSIQDCNLQKKIIIKINENKQKIEKVKRLVSDYKNCSVDKLTPYDYRDYYLSLLEKKLNNAIAAIKTQSDEIGTMLPQDIMSYIIRKDFNDDLLR